MGGATPIVSVLIGDEADTLRAGKFLFDQRILRSVGPLSGGSLPLRRAAGAVQRKSRASRQSTA